jgi:DNA-binding MarR family transcriptional regulator
VRTAAVLGHAFGEALKPLGITPTQYEVLRMLRGARAGGLSRNEIRDRLVTPVPDVTRLLDRMERARLIERERSTRDRRVVATRITSRGLDLLRSIDRVVGDIHRKQLGHLTARQLETLTDLLALARAGGTG